MIAQAVILQGDTLPYFALPVFYCYPELKFKNKKQEEFYWRTVRDVKKVMPYLKHIRGVIETTNRTVVGVHVLEGCSDPGGESPPHL